MTTNESDTQDVSDAALERAGVFGYDKAGHKHSYDPGRAQVIVEDGDGVVHVEQLGRHRVVEWINFVAAEKAGWLAQTWTVDDAGEALRRIEVARNQAADIRYERAKVAAKPEREVATDGGGVGCRSCETVVPAAETCPVCGGVL